MARDDIIKFAFWEHILAECEGLITAEQHRRPQEGFKIF